jgi:Ca2+-transporting ATPase
MDWHVISEKEALDGISSSINGLSSKEASLRLDKYGENKLVRRNNFNALKVFLAQFKSFLIIILIFAAILSVFMESVIDSLVIFAIIILNAGIGFSQEYKAEKAIEGLRKMIVPVTKVVRDGRIMHISSEKLVPGDIIILEEGDKVMADARII